MFDVRFECETARLLNCIRHVLGYINTECKVLRNIDNTVKAWL